jgi:hypothetical protein
MANGHVGNLTNCANVLALHGARMGYVPGGAPALPGNPAATRSGASRAGRDLWTSGEGN